jgi:hypothetical protein
MKTIMYLEKIKIKNNNLLLILHLSDDKKQKNL